VSIKAWYPFYPSDFQRDTELLTLEERLLYRDMLDIYWINSGKISEKDAKNICKKRGFSSQKFDKNWRKVSTFFPIVDGELTNARMDEELDRATKKHEKAVKNGKAGGQAKAKQMLEQKGKQKPSSPQSLPQSLPEEPLKEKTNKPSTTEYANFLIEKYGFDAIRTKTTPGNTTQYLAWVADEVTLAEIDTAVAMARKSFEAKGDTGDPPIRYLAKVIASNRQKPDPVSAGSKPPDTRNYDEKDYHTPAAQSFGKQRA